MFGGFPADGGFVYFAAKSRFRMFNDVTGKSVVLPVVGDREMTGYGGCL